MCLIIFKPADQTLTKGILRNGFESNSDGAGFAYSKNGKLFIEKGFFSFKPLWKAFNNVQKDNPAVIHFRWATHGPKDFKNCHPFEIDDRHAIAHNGILTDFTLYNSKISDTGRFVNEVLRPMFTSDDRLWQQDYIQYLLEAAIGSYNKMVILSADGEFCILNEKQGDWDKGSWFSNGCYKYSRNKVSKPTKTTYYYPSGSHPRFESIAEWQAKQRKFQARSETEKILGAPCLFKNDTDTPATGKVKGKILMKSGHIVDIDKVDEFLERRDRVAREAKKIEAQAAEQAREVMEARGEEIADI